MIADKDKNFWKKLPRPFTVLAPMDNVTDSVFRKIMLKAGRPDVFFTEFTNIDGLVHGGNGIPLRKLKYSFKEHPIVAQLWGTNLENMEKSAKIVVKLGFDGIDINMGCPMKDVVKTGAGAGLIGNNHLARELIMAAKKAGKGIPISIKTRLGFDKNIAKVWLKFLLEQNPAAITIHARTAKQMSSGQADWEEIGKIVKMRDKIAPNTLIIGNGDIPDYEQVVEKSEKYKVDGVMIGRGIFKDLWAFSKNKNKIKNKKKEKVSFLIEHLGLFDKTWGKHRNFSFIKKFFKIYLRGFPGASDVRVKLMGAKNLAEAKKILEKTEYLS